MIPLVHERRPSGHHPYGEGVRARIAGLERRQCPYPRASPEACAWLAGWDGEQARAAPPGRS